MEKDKKNKFPIYDLGSGKEPPPLFCKWYCDEGKVYLETKSGKNSYRTVSLDDLQYQINKNK